MDISTISQPFAGLTPHQIPRSYPIILRVVPRLHFESVAGPLRRNLPIHPAHDGVCLASLSESLRCDEEPGLPIGIVPNDLLDALESRTDARYPAEPYEEHPLEGTEARAHAVRILSV